MRAEVKHDTTARTITVAVTGAPDIDATQHWHSKPRVFRPEILQVNLVDNQIRSVKVSGGLVLESGKSSDSIGESETFYPAGSWHSPKLDKAPEWVATVARESVYGVTTWRTGTDAGEVQEL